MMIEKYPAALKLRDKDNSLPLHIECKTHDSSTIEDVLVMIKKYPAAVKHKNKSGELPLHLECSCLSRSCILSKCIELYPKSLAVSADGLPLHKLFRNKGSSIDDALILIEKYPAALQHSGRIGYLPLHLECVGQCRSTIISKCIELYPESVTLTDKRGDFHCIQ
jgi:hypothetical protein